MTLWRFRSSRCFKYNSADAVSFDFGAATAKYTEKTSIPFPFTSNEIYKYKYKSLLMQKIHVELQNLYNITN